MPAAVWRAREFDDVSSYITIDDVSQLLNTVFTVSLWMNSTSADSSDSLIGFHDSSGGNKWRLQMATGNITINDNATSKEFNDGKWHHIIGTTNGTHSSIYVDGVFYRSDAAYVNIGDTDLASIGQEWDSGPTASDFYDGLIDEVQIWNRVLSPEEINASYKLGVYRLYHNFTNIANGTYNYTAYAQDLAGNVSQTETRILIVDIDNTLPLIAFVSPTPSNGESTTDDWAYINLSISDSGSPNNITSLINWNNSLVGWWRFNREAGENDTLAKDWSGYGNTERCKHESGY